MNQYLVSLRENAQRLQGTIVRENLAEARLKQKAQYDKNVRDNHNFKINDLVRMVNFARVIGQSTGFLDKFPGPLEIARIQNVVYTVKD